MCCEPRATVVRVVFLYTSCKKLLLSLLLHVIRYEDVVMTTVANDLQITTAYKHYISLVPSPHPAFRRLHLSVLQVMESWAGPGNEATSELNDAILIYYLSYIFHMCV